MGKSRKNREKSNRSDPLAKPVKPPTDPELAALREQKIIPIISNLRSDLVSSRTQAVSDVACVVQDEKCRKLLLREQVVHVLLRETIADSSLKSKAAGWSIMRNLALEEDADFSVHLYRLDILTAMENAAQLAVETLSGNRLPHVKTTKLDKYCVREIYTSLTLLTETLSASRDEIKDAITSRSKIIKLICQLATGSPDIEEDAVADALHCLWRISDNNKELVEFILCDNETRIYENLHAAQKDIVTPRAVCSSAILHNIYTSVGWHDANPGPREETDVKNLRTLGHVLRDTNVEAALRDQGDRWQRRLTLLEVALEVVASIATVYQESLGDDGEPQSPAKPLTRKAAKQETLDEEMADGDEEEWNGFGDSVDDMDMEDIEADMDVITGHVDDDTCLKLSDLPTLEGLFHILPDVVELAMGSWRGEERDPERVDSMRRDAIDAVNDIVWTVALFDYGEQQNEDILKHWVPLAKMTWQKVVSAVLSSDTNDVGLASMVTSIAWALSKSVGGGVLLGPKEQTRFIGLYKALGQMDLGPEVGCTDDLQDPFQHPGVKCIGVVGHMARDPAPPEVNKEVFSFLLEVVLDVSTRPAELVEALNQVMDIYADEEKECEKVFWSVDGTVLEKLKQAHAQARKIIKKVDRRNEPELRERGDETLMNFFRFIKYKTKHRPKAS